MQPIDQNEREKILGSYELLSRIAVGGMAEVFLARRLGAEGFTKLVVVKRLRPELARNADNVAMFLDEARIAAAFHHPNLIEVHDLGVRDGEYFIAMEHVPGHTLNEIYRAGLKLGNPPGIAFSTWVIARVLEGLNHAHTALDSTGKTMGIVHQDVSPENILVTFDGCVKVIDFGVAQQQAQAQAQQQAQAQARQQAQAQIPARRIKGKASYMSPEQARGEVLDARSDIFSAGVVLFEMVTGARLFKANDEIETMRRVEACRVPSPRSLNPAIPKDLEDIILRALHRDRNARYRSAREMQVALDTCIAGWGIMMGTAEASRYMEQLFKEEILQHRKQIGSLIGESRSATLPRTRPPGAERRSSPPSTDAAIGMRESREERKKDDTGPNETTLASALQDTSSEPISPVFELGLSEAQGDEHRSALKEKSNFTSVVIVAGVLALTIVLGIAFIGRKHTKELPPQDRVPSETNIKEHGSRTTPNVIDGPAKASPIPDEGEGATGAATRAATDETTRHDEKKRTSKSLRQPPSPKRVIKQTAPDKPAPKSKASAGSVVSSSHKRHNGRGAAPHPTTRATTKTEQRKATPHRKPKRHPASSASPKRKSKAKRTSRASASSSVHPSRSQSSVDAEDLPPIPNRKTQAPLSDVEDTPEPAIDPEDLP